MFEKQKAQIAGWLINSLKTNADGTNSPFEAMFQQRLTGFLTGATDESEYLKEYRGWVYACVKRRSTDVGNIQLRLFKNETEVTNPKDPLLAILNKVNPTMTKTGLFKATRAFLDLDGNCFWYLARSGKNGKGILTGIYLLRPDRVTLVPSSSDPLLVAGYIYVQPDGTKIPFDPKEILHLKEFNPMAEHPFPHRGMGIVQAASWAIDTENEAKTWNYNFFRNSARPGGILLKDGGGTLNDADYFRIRTQWEQNHQGSQNNGKVAILGGGVKWQEIARSQKDMDFIAQRQFSRDEIFAMFGVPKSILGIVEDVNRANADASNFVYNLLTIKPAMEDIVTQLQEFLLPEFGDNLRLDFDSPVPEDEATQLQEYSAGAGNWITKNEIRKRKGLDPIPNGDDLYVPLNMQVIGTVPPPKKTPSPSKSTVKVFGAPVSKDPVENIINNKINRFIAKKNLTKEAVGNYVQLWKTLFDIYELPLKKKMHSYFNAQEKEVLANLEKRHNKSVKAGDDEEDPVSPDVNLFAYFDEQLAIENAINLITPFIQQYIDESGGQAMQLTGSGLNFESDLPQIADYIDGRASFFADSITETTGKELLASLRDGLNAGETFDQLSKRVAEVYSQARDYRTDRIARTEIAAAGNFGAIEAYKQAGVEKIAWVVVAPEDEDCVSADGEVIKMGETFSNGLEEPPVHPNCQCTTVPVFD